jgi:phosphoglycolate phosphatase
MRNEIDDLGTIVEMPRIAQPASAHRRALPRVALFDLDGTLIDSVPDITAAVAELLASEQLPPLSQDQVRMMIGRGLKVLVRRVYDAQGIALDEASLECRLADMREVYPRHLVGKTTLMPGVKTALAFLRDSGCRLAVVTNKPVEATETILKHFRLRELFDEVIGDSNEPALAQLARKPQPDMLLEAMRRLGVTPAEVVMIGDSGVDVRAARAAGVTAIAIRGGYCADPLESFTPDLLLPTLADLPAVFKA